MGVGFAIDVDKVALDTLVIEQLADYIETSEPELFAATAKTIGAETSEETAQALVKTLGAKKVLSYIKQVIKPNIVEFIAVMDNRTTQICTNLNGRRWRVGSSNIKTPPLHWNCRSMLSYQRGEL